MRRHPIPSVNGDVAVRMRIGAKMLPLVLKDCQTKQPALVPHYLTHPPQKFYTDRATRTQIRRIYGLMETTDGPRAHTVLAMSCINNDTVGGVSLDKLVPLDAWSDQQLARLNSGLISSPELFLDPLAFPLLCGT